MQSAIIELRKSLARYDAREAQSIIDLLLDEVCHISRIDRILSPDLVLPEGQRSQLLACAEQLRQGVPVQQALGYEWFCGERFKVTPDVLIPRPETAELVDWICKDIEQLRSTNPEETRQQDISILDIGTGSGCIAISLARLINNSQVLAIDISTAALNVACENSCQQGVENVYFSQCDILSAVDNLDFEQQVCSQLSTYQPRCSKDCQQQFSNGFTQEKQVFNIIVSNPPYICQQETKDMSSIVLDHEPSQALFVPDNDPLLFYRAIAKFGCGHLSTDGCLYFEINAAYGAETCAMLQEMGYKDVELRQDINGRDRMVKACK